MSEINDTDRLEWLLENRALIHRSGHTTPFYFVVYRNGETGAGFRDPRQAIDKEIETERSRQ